VIPIYGAVIGLAGYTGRTLFFSLQGDQTLFSRNDEVIEQWRFSTEIIDAWENSRIKKLPQYPAKTWGPAEAKEFIEADGRLWRFDS
jgi:glucose-6-phosphate 1-dehydrogenase